MYDAGKVIIGLGVFVVIVTSPIWYNLASGKGSYVPEPVLPQGQCIENAEWMRHQHMTLLNDWRTEVIRNDQRIYSAQDGNIYDKSLTNTCLKCHKDTTQFCDRCHNYTAVDPFCWDCHVIPEVKTP